MNRRGCGGTITLRLKWGQSNISQPVPLASRYCGVETGLTLRPGQNGTKKLVERYGERLVRVRYLYDALTFRRLKTVELIVESVAIYPYRFASTNGCLYDPRHVD